MTKLANATKAIPAILTAVALLASGAAASAQDTPENLNRWTEKLDYEGPLPDRPTLIGDRIVWGNRALSDLCAELDGTFRKLAGRSEYMCRLSGFDAGSATARNGQRE